MKHSIVLIGFMGTGKTEVGKVLSKRLKFNFFDIDNLIEEKTGLKINNIFKKFRENYFRQIEAQIVKEISKEDFAVIACGGGTALNRDNIAILRAKSVIINLYACAEVIYERIKNNNDRPILKCQDPLIKIKELLQVRKDVYINCDFSFNTGGLSILEVVEGLINKINWFHFCV
ncbi:MAG: shikimate kinase [Endomicrobium sp.]|jgi:shikimate kinase|uniref:shikimate kinase n=1 Tax=Candidatus Endomicrobiellum cubanum TaxID=3242325 RepID=UPI00283A5375|nr:shikimate kinase [Endomicrobium sp.]